MDGLENKQGVTTSAETKETSEKEPETFTMEQAEERERKATSDVSAEMGRVKKLNADLIKSSQAIQDRLEKREREEDERERARYRDEPDKLDAVDERIKRRTLESELAKKEQELEEERGKTKEVEEAEVKSTKERNAREIASKYEVDLETLKLTDGSVEAMEALAKTLSGKGIKTLKPDGSKTSGGGGGIPTDMGQFRNWVANLSQSEFEERSEEINKMMKQGKIK